ncbi:MAG: hypothetical protein HZA37_00095 [Parcubacteria group bacterium]|nr:hypothetical protein [Parcubacteria group bacterium]
MPWGILAVIALVAGVMALSGKFKEHTLITAKLALVTVACFFVSLVGGMPFPFQWEEKERVAIAELARPIGERGASKGFFVGVGDDVNGKPFFRFLQESGEGYYPEKLKKSDRVTIHEENRENGILVVFESRFSNTWVDVFFFNPGWKRYELHVPIGGVMKEWLVQPPLYQKKC